MHGICRDLRGLSLSAFQGVEHGVELQRRISAFRA